MIYIYIGIPKLVLWHLKCLEPTTHRILFLQKKKFSEVGPIYTSDPKKESPRIGLNYVIILHNLKNSWISTRLACGWLDDPRYISSFQSWKTVRSQKKKTDISPLLYNVVGLSIPFFIYYWDKLKLSKEIGKQSSELRMIFTQWRDVWL